MSPASSENEARRAVEGWDIDAAWREPGLPGQVMVYGVGWADPPEVFAVDAIARVLGEHYHWYDGDCGDVGLCEADTTCPKYDGMTLDAARDAHAAHQAEQVAELLRRT